MDASVWEVLRACCGALSLGTGSLELVGHGGAVEDLLNALGYDVYQRLIYGAVCTQRLRNLQAS